MCLGLGLLCGRDKFQVGYGIHGVRFRLFELLRGYLRGSGGIKALARRCYNLGQNILPLGGIGPVYIVMAGVRCRDLDQVADAIGYPLQRLPLSIQIRLQVLPAGMDFDREGFLFELGEERLGVADVLLDSLPFVLARAESGFTLGIGTEDRLLESA
jgi:hypothetical protein